MWSLVQTPWRLPAVVPSDPWTINKALHPNADHLVNTNHHWTIKCRAELTSGYIECCCFDHTRWVSKQQRLSNNLFPGSSAGRNAPMSKLHMSINRLSVDTVRDSCGIVMLRCPLQFEIVNDKHDLMHLCQHWVAAQVATQPMLLAIAQLIMCGSSIQKMGLRL